MSHVVGLDLSLTATGIAEVDAEGRISVSTIKTPKAKIEGHERLAKILNDVTGNTLGADLVVVEGPSFGSQGNALHQMGGLWWLVTQRLWTTRVPYIIATPSQVKKFLTGNGNADKDLVVIEAVKRFPHVEIRNNNEADAVGLAAIGRRLAGAPIEDMPKAHLDVIEKIRKAHEEAA